MLTGNKRYDLLPCPCCDGSVMMFETEYPNGERGWLMSACLNDCLVCGSIGSVEPEDIERFVTDWNTRKAVEHD